MKRLSFLCIGILLCSCAVSAFCQEQTETSVAEAPASFACNFSVEAGLAWRNFRTTKFRGTIPPGYQGVFSRSDADGMVGEYFANFSQIGTVHRDEAVIVYKDAGSTERKKDVDAGDKFGPAIGMSYQFWQKDSLYLAAVLGFQYYELYKTSSGIQGGESSSYQTIIPGIPAAPERDYHDTNYLAASTRTKFDMSLYAFDLGFRLGFAPLKSFHLFAGAGPTLAIADMNSTDRYSVVRNVDGEILVGGKATSNSRDWIFGVYATCGAEYMFTEHFGISAEVRYDNAFDSADTKFAVQTLDSFGGMIKLVWKF